MTENEFTAGMEKVNTEFDTLLKARGFVTANEVNMLIDKHVFGFSEEMLLQKYRGNAIGNITGYIENPFRQSNRGDN
ncbi:MAG: hypothetical protein J6Y02_21650 [Pseudobutyrivibrio sp.]|nr:hypothetical protein [Pseudobutyrivibrio sp.]